VKSANSKPFYFILASFVLVFSISFLGNNLDVLGLQIKNINIISDLTREEEIPVATDSVPDVKNDSTLPVPDFRTSEEIIGYEEHGSMEAFVRALHELKEGKRKKVRIGYFGDSMIEGDLVTQDLRQQLQAFFGGVGVGFVPVTSIVAGFRQSIIHSFSENWTDSHFLNSSSKQLFLSGHSFTPSETSSVYYAMPGKGGSAGFGQVQLLYGLTDSAAGFMLNDSSYLFRYQGAFNKQLVTKGVRQLRASFSGRHNQVYGFSFESERGVFVDNFAFRGISGSELRRITPEMLQAIDSLHHYDLIILQYGPNLLFKPELADFEWYEKPMKQTILTLKKNLPGTSILVVGSADKASRYDGEYMTQKGVMPLIKVQERIARETGTNFWNLYNAMGGKNSMIRWVNSRPPLANVDYTHLTHKGATKVALLLFEKIMQVYDPEAVSRAQIQPVVRYVSASRGL